LLNRKKAIILVFIILCLSSLILNTQNVKALSGPERAREGSYLFVAAIAVAIVGIVVVTVLLKRKKPNAPNSAVSTFVGESAPKKQNGEDSLHLSPSTDNKPEGDLGPYSHKSDYIFICYIENDAETAVEIAKGLEEAGYATWYYQRDSLPGPSYLLQTSQAIVKSQAVVLLISIAAMSSSQVTKEIVRAHEAGKPFIPVMRGITHADFQRRQPEWREAIGAAASISIPVEGTAAVLPRIIAGLKELGLNKKQ